jgi:rubrerythrin
MLWLVGDEEAATNYSYSQLSELDALGIDELRSLFTIELGGERFYQALADMAGSDQAAELLRRNGREEAAHARRVARAVSIKLGSDFQPTSDMLEVPEVRLPDSLPAILPALIEGERQGDAIYQKWAENEPDPAVARLLRLNGREESLHAGRVEQVRAILDRG